MELLREEIDGKERINFFPYTHLSVHGIHLWERLVGRMSIKIEEKSMQEICYSLRTGQNSMQEIAESHGLSIKKVALLYEVAVTEVMHSWDIMDMAQEELGAIRYTNCKPLLPEKNIVCTPVRDDVPSRGFDIPAEYVEVLSMPLANFEIQPRILRRLRKYNIYLLEDLLRFIKKNGFNALSKLHGVGVKSCEDLYLVLKQENILKNKDDSCLFRYIPI